MPIGMYRQMSDRDVKAIVAYLRTVKPVRFPATFRDNGPPPTRGRHG